MKLLFFYYVPILKTIETLLKLENVWKQCTTESRFTNKDKNVFEDILDGYYNTRNEFFKNNKLYDVCVKIMLYQDSFEICNPLGASRKKHKILGI